MNTREIELKMIADINLVLQSNITLMDTVKDLIEVVTELKKEISALKKVKK